MTTPVLKKIDEFRAVLDGYQMSKESRHELAAIKLALLSSVTSAGRNTIMHELVKTGKYQMIVSDTTRPMRKKDGKVVETDGVEYWFRTEEEVLADLKLGNFIEAELIHQQQVSGISIREVVKTYNSGKIAITDVDYGGGHTIAKAKPDTDIIMVLPPNHEVWMQRLVSRHDMHESELTNRLQTAKSILIGARQDGIYKLVVNDKLKDAVATVRSIIEDGKYTNKDHENGLLVADSLLKWVEEQLK